MDLLMIPRQMLRDLRHQKLRTALTLFGITWGTIGVALLLAFGEALQKQTVDNAQQMGVDLVICWPGRTTMSYNGLPKGRAVRVNEEDIEALKREIPQGLFAGQYSRGGLHVRRGTRQLSPQVIGAMPEFADLRNITPAAGGRFIDAIDVAERRRVVFLGNKLKTDLFGKGPAVGETITIDTTPMLVIGVLEPKGQQTAYGGPDANNVWIPAPVFWAMSKQLFVSNFIFKARDREETPLVTRRVWEVLGARRQFNPGDKEAIGHWDSTEATEFFSVLFISIRVFLAVIGVCTLIVGGIGVSNIMYVVIEERTREIGIKMAVGAKPRTIQAQFLIETMLLTGLGGLLGFLFTLAVLGIFPSFHLDEYVGRPHASPLVILATSVLLGLVGLVAGYFPARRASMLDPVVALKLS